MGWMWHEFGKSCGAACKSWAAFDPGHGVFFENSRTGLEVIAADVVIFDQLSDMDAKIDNPCFDLVLAD